MRSKISAAAVAVVAATGLAACSDGAPEAPVATVYVTETAAPGDESLEGDESVSEDMSPEDDSLGGEDVTVPEPPWDPGTFEAYSPGGARLVIQIPADDVPKELEAARKKMEADPVVYLSVDVDNREGQNYVNMYEVNLFDPDGTKYTFSGASNAVDEWFYDVGTDTNEEIDLYNEGIDLSSKYNDGVDVSQRSTMILVGEEIPEQIADVQVYAEGGFEVSFAYPVDR